LDNLGDIVSNEVGLPIILNMSDKSKQIVEARRNPKLDEAKRVAAVESERIRMEGVEARRKALVIADKASDVTKSPPPEKYLGLDKSAQENFHSKMGDYKGSNRRVEPTPDLLENYNAARDTYLSDGQLGAMALEAWRSHLRKMHEYLPDRDIPKATHLDHLKVLSSALTDFKRQRTALNLWGESAVAYKHERYALFDLPEVSHPSRSLLPEGTNAIRGTEGDEHIIQKEVLPAQQVLQHVAQGHPWVHASPGL
jgi:hypothetical protein